MASTKEFFTRIQHKHDIEANWLKATNFIPLVGEIIIYDSDTVDREIVINEETVVIPACNYQRIKIGDGETVVSSLSFFDGDMRAALGVATDIADEAGTAFARIAKNVADIEDITGKHNALEDRVVELEKPLYTETITHKKISQDSDLILSDIIETYILNIDYNSKIKFDTTEIVINGAASDSTTAVLGKAILGKMILG